MRNKVVKKFRRALRDMDLLGNIQAKTEYNDEYRTFHYPKKELDEDGKPIIKFIKVPGPFLRRYIPTCLKHHLEELKRRYRERRKKGK